MFGLIHRQIVRSSEMCPHENRDIKQKGKKLTYLVLIFRFVISS